jgi:hypothetical protein
MVHRSPLARFGLLTFTLVLCVVVAGCGAGVGRKSRVTKENYDKIKNDMSEDDVVDLLGKGQPVGDGGGAAAAVGVDISGGQGPSNTEKYAWENGDQKIEVSFRRGKVVGKSKTGF